MSGSSSLFYANVEALEKLPATLLIKVGGRLDASTVSQFERALMEAHLKGGRAILVDMSQLQYISSSGLRTLLSARAQIRKRGGDIFLFALSPPVREVFDMVGFSAVFSVFDSTEQALQAASILAQK